ncbi:LysR substrate-binding domain-containing protein [Pseudomonas asiatica]|uniref:LysR substrate-binding domain-containing protein n=1 Tax=Pseudomonas TaxID=286 RepID=UPI00061FEB8A|nr:MULTISPECIES: LysR substrate-binding domain-containing protein [Pseudomonas]KIY42139.1 LysR family transcriptional regulator [Pseudomonas sp. 10-1B]MEB6592639.1 LysR substrate-binding domain-containing protein [Pseudomonas asiatica]
MELRHLRYFVMVAEEQHFTRAAARLNMQQPPLSQQIRALEDELGFALFIRHPKGVALTAGGEVFLQEARDILARVGRGAHRAARVAHGIAGTLALGFTSSAAAHALIPRIIRAYRERYPDVELTVSEDNAQGLTHGVAEGRLDMAILRAPVSTVDGVSYHRLLNEEMVLALPVDHPLFAGASGEALQAMAQRGFTLQALADEPFILVRKPGAPGMYANLVKACRNAGFEPRIACEIERMLTNLSLVAAGAGISAVPASMTGLHDSSIVYCRIRDARPRLVAPVTLACRTFNPTPAQDNFVALARQMAGRPCRREGLPV